MIFGSLIARYLTDSIPVGTGISQMLECHSQYWKLPAIIWTFGYVVFRYLRYCLIHKDRTQVQDASVFFTDTVL